MAINVQLLRGAIRLVRSFPTYEEALAKLQHFCAYQERCHNEVRSKLININCFGDMLEDVIAALIQEDFLNEQRFAETFTSGKYRLKSWGRNKIRQALKKKYVSDYCIRKGLASIDEIEYMKTLERTMRKYHHRYEHLNAFELRGRIFNFGMNKGYTATEMNFVLDEILGKRK